MRLDVEHEFEQPVGADVGEEVGSKATLGKGVGNLVGYVVGIWVVPVVGRELGWPGVGLTVGAGIGL